MTSATVHEPTPTEAHGLLSARDRAAEARRLLATVVGWNLVGCSVVLPSEALDQARWASLMRLARTQRAEGPLATAVASGALPVTPSQADDALTAHRAAMSLTLLLERELLGLYPRLVEAGVDVRVLKGTATAHLDEPDPANRAFGDLDLLIPAAALPTTVRIVEAGGGIRRHLEPRPGFDVRFTKGVSFRFPRNSEIDLHRTLAAGPFGLLIDLDELFDGIERFTIAGTELLALDRPGRFLHACYHAALGDPYPRLTTLRDIVRTAPRTDLECRNTLGRAARWQGEAVVAAAVGHTEAAFGWSPPEPLASWAAHSSPPARQQRWLRAYAGEERLPALQAIQGLVAVDGVTDRVAYARAIAFPQRSAGRTPSIERARRGTRAIVALTRSRRPPRP